MNTQTGRVIKIGEIKRLQLKDNRTFEKRELMIDCTFIDPYTGARSKYENFLNFEFTGDKVILLDNINLEDIVTISFYLQGNSYTDHEGNERYSINVRAAGIDVKRPAPTKAHLQQEKPDDDIPF